MEQISKESARRIASLINTIEVSRDIRQSSMNRNNEWHVFRKREVESVVALAEEFGIKLPTYELMLPEHEQYEREFEEHIERCIVPDTHAGESRP